MDFKDIKIGNPKRIGQSRTGWEGFFPYYAGYPEAFVTSILSQLDLPPNSLVADPWNGSGTTTYASNLYGMPSWGGDLNPAMVIVAKARLLPPSEADSLVPLAREICRFARRVTTNLDREPLANWFDDETSIAVRAIELSIRRHLIGRLTAEGSENRLHHMSTLAAAFYVSLFALVRGKLGSVRTSNPTWLKSSILQRVCIPKAELHAEFQRNLMSMAISLRQSAPPTVNSFCPSVVEVSNTTESFLKAGVVDLIITSPPYCTRLDYTSATKIELALVEPWLGVTQADLSKKMIGTVKVPRTAPESLTRWGPTCLSFLESVRLHRSKASSGYYFKNHADYFAKLSSSMENVSDALRLGGRAVLVVQDSYYKEVHNPLSQIVSEMAVQFGLREVRRDCFDVSRSLSNVNSRSNNYRTYRKPVESVLCFEKDL